MQPFVKLPRPNENKWVYVSLAVLDGERKLKPTHVGPDSLRFNEPPRLKSGRVEIILINGEEEYRRMAIVLPHDADATQIPIWLITEAKP